MTFLDGITTEKWTKLLSWGVEGEAYEVDENGKFYRTPEQRKEQESSALALKNRLNAFLNYAPKIEGTFSDGNVYGPGNDPEEFYASLSDYNCEFLMLMASSLGLNSTAYLKRTLSGIQLDDSTCLTVHLKRLQRLRLATSMFRCSHRSSQQMISKQHGLSTSQNMRRRIMTLSSTTSMTRQWRIENWSE